MDGAVWGGSESARGGCAAAARTRRRKDYRRTDSAARGGRIWGQGAVRLLLEQKADVKAKDKDGKTALHQAAWLRNNAMVQ